MKFSLKIYKLPKAKFSDLNDQEFFDLNNLMRIK